MRIGIDIQTLETNERRRGIGKLCATSIAALMAHAPGHEYLLFGASPEVPGEAVPLVDAGAHYVPIRIEGDVPSHLRLGCAAPFLWSTPEAFDLDLYHVTSPMMDDILLPDSGPCPIAATLLDAIPAVMRELRQPLLDAAGWKRYSVRANVVRRYQQFLPISEATASDCVRFLDFAKERMSVTWIPVAQRPAAGLSAGDVERVLSRHSLKPGYVISLSGYHPRKNIQGTLASYARLPRAIRNRHPLVLVCALNECERDCVAALARRERIEGNLVMTGFVPDEELVALLKSAGVMFLPSRYEGFGIPVAEAMSCGVPVVASNVSSLPEVAGDAGLLFAPEDHSGFADALGRVLSSAAFARDLQARGFMQVERFSPGHYVERLIGAYGRTSQSGERSAPQVDVGQDRGRPLRLAFFSPLSPRMSGISEYSEQLLLNLSPRVEPDCFIEDYTPAHPAVRNRFRCLEHHLFPRRHAGNPYDLVLYQVGNNTLHSYMLPYMERWPGVVVLHDYSLLGMHRVLAQQFGERRAAQLRFAAEYPEVDASVWEEDRRLDALEFMEYPMTRRVIAGSRATIVHSEWLKEHLAELAGNGARIEDIPLGVDFGAADAPRPSADELRRRYRIPPGAFVVVSVGVVNRLKRLREVLKAFSEFRLHCPDSHFLLVGPADRIVLRDLSGMCGAMRLKHCVHFLGHRSLAELHDVIHMADVCVNLRYPTMGESSATLMSIMAMAKPVLVTPVGQFLEFPDDVCWKVRLGNHERRDIVEYFRCLRDHPDAGRKLGENARRHVLGWSWAQAAKKYEDLLCSVVDES